MKLDHLFTFSAYERGIVTWIPDSEVPACLNCGKSFGFLTRRHHCRLCGGIMCDKCSEFMASSYARKFSMGLISLNIYSY